MLKELVAQYPDLKVICNLIVPHIYSQAFKGILRAAIAKYDIDVEDVLPAESGIDTPIWASLGASSENPRDDFTRSESDPHELVSPAHLICS